MMLSPKVRATLRIWPGYFRDTALDLLGEVIDFMARPRGFEPLTFAFGGQRTPKPVDHEFRSPYQAP